METNPAPPTSTTPAPEGAGGGVSAAGALRLAARLFEPAVPAELLADPEQARRVRLASRFGTLGSIFGVIYASFYFAIGHRWGVLIILLCSLVFALASFLMRRTKSVNLTAHVLCLTLTLGFSALCCVEGGLQGHAIAWLVSIPLIGFLLVGRSAGRMWAGMAFGAAACVAGASLAGIHLPRTYDPKWETIVSSAGYLGLVVFMYLLGLIFEIGRHDAFSKMQSALQDLAASNTRLVNLNQEKNEFLGVAAHDLKNPLSVIVGCAELIGTSYDQAQNEELSGMIVAAASRMRSLISDFLDVSAIEQGKYVSKIERCDITSLVRESVEHNRAAAARKGQKISLGTSEGLWAKADRSAVLRVLDNLISNALKYSPPNTTAHVHTMPEVNNIVIMVRDEGPGISEEDQKKMFGKFTRLTARPTGDESSTGLGLSIVKRLAESMGGSILCHSKLGSGSTFAFRIPVWRAATSTPPAPPPAKPPLARLPQALTTESQVATAEKATSVWLQGN